MAKKKKSASRKAAPSLRCAATLKPGGKGLCYSVERVQRNSHKGYITAFHARASGRPAGFAAAPGACKKTMDPFQATIRKNKSDAEKVGEQCARASTKK